MEPEHSWDQFLQELPPQAAGQALELWQTLEGSVGKVPPPYAAATETSGVSLVWDCGQHFFEIEVLADGTERVRALEEEIARLRRG